MKGFVAFESDRLVLQAEQSWFTQPALIDATGWADENGWLSFSGRLTTFELPLARWTDLGRPPSSDEPEQQDLWIFEHECVCKLLGVRDESLILQAIGHVGGKSLKIQLSANGAVCDVSQSEPPKVVNTRGEPLLLSPLGSEIVCLLKQFTASPEHSRGEQLNMIAELKVLRAAQQRLAQESGRMPIELDPHLDSFDIAEPAKFSLRWADEGRNRLSLQLFIDGESEPLSLSDLDEHSPVIEMPGRRTILLDAGTEAVARRARALTQVRKEKAGDALHNPMALIPEGVETPRLDFSEYSHRILGFEPAKRESASVAYTSGTAWYDKDDDGEAQIFLSVHNARGNPVQLSFADAAEAIEAAVALERAAELGKASVELQGHAVMPEPKHAQNLLDIVKRHYPAPAHPEDVQPDEADSTQGKRISRLRAVLSDVERDGEQGTAPPPPNLEEAVPWSLLTEVLSPEYQLKHYQRAGIAWLWHRYTEGASGALLADDMGLGKTLQIAAFIAITKLSRRDKPKKPSLIVAPVVLVENWRKELGKCFVGPFPGRLLSLRDEALRNIRGSDGTLDRESLKTYDVVVTNYETLARHAVSLLGIDWDVVVLDEAHRIKNRGTQWSIAARGLSGAQHQERPRKFDFAICATGTPVENAITDLWALYDFLSPGRPFGGFEEFRRQYEDDPLAPKVIASELRVGSFESSLLRRTKAEALPELPAKTYHQMPVPMTAYQEDQERAIVRSPASRSGGPLKILEQLQKLYQHPWLLEADDARQERHYDEAIAASPKLKTCIKLLEQIQPKQEKVLVFTLWTRMQWLLKDVLQQRFQLPDIRIINGDPKNAKRAQDHIEAFSATPGFAVMILSPLAAGVGLTITAANHVIHYGRWWNPAKEDQASDRAYRIGQTLPVNIYYPLLHHSHSPDQGFDIKLDELVSRKRAMARDLLDPTEADDISLDELSAIGMEYHHG